MVTRECSFKALNSLIFRLRLLVSKMDFNLLHLLADTNVDPLQPSLALLGEDNALLLQQQQDLDRVLLQPWTTADFISEGSPSPSINQQPQHLPSNLTTKTNSQMCTTEMLTAEPSEQDALDEKRKRSNLASARFRQRKKQKEQQLELELERWKETASAQEKRIADLEQENKLLRDLLLHKK